MINLETYLKNKAERPERRLRLLCPRCLQPHRTCYCEHIQSFDPKIRFAILIHPLEVRKRIATGRMSHLILSGSKLIHGFEFDNNPDVNDILNDPDTHSVILYPGRNSTDLSRMTASERSTIFTEKKSLTVFVLDGTWSTAGKMRRRSRNLRDLPRICFTPSHPSTFRVRKQPGKECYSTIEAIHETIDLLGPAQGFDAEAGEHGKLLHVFDKMVEQQLAFVEESRANGRHSRHKRKVPGTFCRSGAQE